MAKKPPKTAAAVHPNAGVEAWYRRELEQLIVKMYRDLYARVKLVWEGEPEATHAMDAPKKPPPMDLLQRAMNKWGGLWVKRIENLSERMAEEFANKNRNVTDAAVKRSFANAGLTIKFRPTRAMIEGYKAVVAENVSLIKSIPAEALKKAEGEIYRAVTKGSDLATLTEKLRDGYQVTYNRAALISRDQNNKAKAVFEAARRSEAGITEAVWMHSHGGAEPRPSHVKLDGTKYTIAKGAWDSHEQAWIQPGELINCRCVSKAVLPFSE
jgi:SPP1 gp7 family putative phage head morphogenesis protein